MRLIVVLIAAIGAEACQRELNLHHHHRRERRQEASAPPTALDANEQILVDSFNTTSLATWSYYYSKSAHMVKREFG